MQIEKVYFGCQQPDGIEYRVQPSGTAEVWLYQNIIQNEDGEYEAEGVHFFTVLPIEQIEAQRDSYFTVEEPEPTISDLVEALDILTSIVLGEEG